MFPPPLRAAALGLGVCLAIAGCGGGGSSSVGGTTGGATSAGGGKRAIHEPIQSRGIKGEDPSAEAASRAHLSTADCKELAALAEDQLGTKLSRKSTPAPPLSRCQMSGGGVTVNVYLDAGFAAHQRYDNRIEETVQFNTENPRGLPQPVPHVGEKAAYNADANWIPAIRSLLAVRGNRWLTVNLSAPGLTDDELRDEAAVLARAGFKLTIPEAGDPEAKGPADPVGHHKATEPKREAERDAERRLRQAPTAPGSHPVSHLPRKYGLEGAEFAPRTPNLVHREAFFLTKLDAAEAFAWLRAHPPRKAGAQRLLTSGGEGAYTSRTIGFRWGDSRQVSERAQYDTVVARPAGGAAIRIETQAVWIEPHPEAENIPADARLLELKLVHRGRREAAATIRDPAEVAEFAALIDDAQAVQPGGPESCEEPGEYPHHLTLTFRSGPGGTVLAEAEQDMPIGDCQLLRLKIEGKKAEPLEPSGALVSRSLERLGVKSGPVG
jgi:hypothetical protein